MNELMHHSWLSEDESTLTHEGVLIPLSPASSNPGFNMDYDYTTMGHTNMAPSMFGGQTKANFLPNDTLRSYNASDSESVRFYSGICSSRT